MITSVIRLREDVYAHFLNIAQEKKMPFEKYLNALLSSKMEQDLSGKRRVLPMPEQEKLVANIMAQPVGKAFSLAQVVPGWERMQPKEMRPYEKLFYELVTLAVVPVVPHLNRKGHYVRYADKSIDATLEEAEQKIRENVMALKPGCVFMFRDAVQGVVVGEGECSWNSIREHFRKMVREESVPVVCDKESAHVENDVFRRIATTGNIRRRKSTLSSIRKKAKDVAAERFDRSINVMVKEVESVKVGEKFTLRQILEEYNFDKIMMRRLGMHLSNLVANKRINATRVWPNTGVTTYTRIEEHKDETNVHQ